MNSASVVLAVALFSFKCFSEYVDKLTTPNRPKLTGRFWPKAARHDFPISDTRATGFGESGPSRRILRKRYNRPLFAKVLLPGELSNHDTFGESGLP